MIVKQLSVRAFVITFFLRSLHSGFKFDGHDGFVRETLVRM